MSQAASFWTRIVSLASLAGTLPFLIGLLATLFPQLWPFDPALIERMVIGYGALILSFLGGVRWGLRLQGGAGSDLTFVMGILGSALGLFTLLVPYTLGLVMLTIGFGLHGLWDARSGGVPQFYARLRSIMTWIVCSILLATLVAGFIV